MSKLAELLAQKAALEKQIAETQREERAAAVEQARALVEQYGLTAADLFGNAGRSGKPASKPAPRAARKVAAKYRDPATGNSWSGRGLQPNWLKAALAAGRKIGDFAV